MNVFFQHSQRGITRLGAVAAIVIVLGIASVAWWILRDDNGDTTSNESTASRKQQDAVENARCDYDDQDLCKFFASWNEADYYTIESTSKTNDKTTTTRIQQEGDDKTYVRFSGDISYETILIGDTLYTKAGDIWYKQKLSAEQINNYRGNVDTDLTEPDPNNNTRVTYTKIGTETCGEETCFKYEVSDDNAPGTTQHIWFDNESFRLRRMQVSGGGTSYDAAFSYEDVNINEPSPSQDLGPNQQLTPGQSTPTPLPRTGDTPSPEELEKILEQYR